MKTVSTYTEFHPRWHRSRVSTYWWMGRWPYLKFILRELSSVFVACFVAVLLLQLQALKSGPQHYAEFQQWLQRPAVLAFNGIGFLFVLFHAVTWFNLAPRAMVVGIGGKRVPDIVIAAANYAAWLALSAAIAWLMMG